MKTHLLGCRLILAILTFLLSIYYPLTAQIKPEKVEAANPVNVVPILNKSDCSLLKVGIKRLPKGRTPCNYQITLNNGLNTQAKIIPAAFRVEFKNGAITDISGKGVAWQQTPASVPPKVSKVTWTQVKIPSGKSTLANIGVEVNAPGWMYCTWLNRAGGVLCLDSIWMNDCIFEPESACKNQLIRNGEFAPSTGPVPANWGIGYGAPKFLNTTGDGFLDPGYAELAGNQNNGDAIVQTLALNNKILKGRKYVLQVGVKFIQGANMPNYCRIRALAWNLTMGSNGLHPNPGSDVAIIGRSGRVRACSDWSIIEFPVWVANKDFQNIAINAFTNDNTVSKIRIDNISFCEVDQGYDCDEVPLDASNNPVMPSGYGSFPPGFSCPVDAEPVDEYNNGSLSDLYGQLYGYNGTTGWYSQASDKCFSLGGTIPPEVDKFSCDDSLKILGINMSCDELQKGLANPNLPISQIKPPPLPPIQAPQNGACPNVTLPNAVEMPFKGRDIIFIHGLQLDHLCDRANGVMGALANWPDATTQQEFYSGYYKNVALANFMPHILHYIQNQGYKNRYLVVSYNCSQSAEIAAHCVLTQIREAMETGKGVVMMDPKDPRGTSCFGREYIFVSHSTGALVADIALSVANMTKTNTSMKTKWGDIGLLSDRCKGRVSFRGAFGGSDLATLLVAFQGNSNLSKFASGRLTKNICHTDFSYGVNRNMVLNSVLVDLVPSVSQSRWGIYLNAVPVPVIEISSGHPTDIVYFLKYRLHPGFDDGVLSIDCSSGNTMTASLRPTRFRASKKIRVFDMGSRTFRAINYYRDQVVSGDDFASGCTPYLSPTGMVQPVAQVLSSASRYANHFTFIQSASEHWLEDNYSSGKYEPTLWEKSDNWEEELVVEDNALFASGVISLGIVSEMNETIKEKVIYYPALRIKIVKGIPRPVIVWKKFYIWKRTYHTLRGQNLYDYDYAYRYLFKN